MSEVTVMYDHGVGSAWMMLMPVVWLVLIVAVVWAVVSHLHAVVFYIQRGADEG